MSKIIHKKICGFSLVETLIAVTILMIAITGPLALVQAGLFSANHVRNQIIATYLAQEALEYIRSMRDANYYKNISNDTTTWLMGPDGSTPLTTTCGSGCLVDPHGGIDGSLFIKASGTNPPIYKKIIKDSTPSGTFFSYGYDTNSDTTNYTYTKTSFTRKVTVAAVQGSSKEVTVSVTITWKDNALERTYTVSENLLDYQIADPSANSGDNIVLSSTDATPPTQAISGPFNGVYTLESDLTCASLTINNDITLDLKGHNIDSGCDIVVDDNGNIIDTSANANNNSVSYYCDGTNTHNEQCNGSVGSLSCSDFRDSNGNPLGGTGLRCSGCYFDTSQCTVNNNGGTYE